MLAGSRGWGLGVGVLTRDGWTVVVDSETGDRV